MVGKGKLTYTALVSNVGIFPVDSDPAETLRMGSERFSAALRRDRAAEKRSRRTQRRGTNAGEHAPRRSA